MKTVYIFLLLVVFAVSETHTETPTQPSAEPPLWKSSSNSDFYQTIIDNNLFAPLGTVLKKKPVPGANLKRIATMTKDNPSQAKAILQNIATGEQKTVRVGDTIGGYNVLDIQPKQILIEKDGETAVWKRLNPSFLYYGNHRNKSFLSDAVSLIFPRGYRTRHRYL